jgi:hypothetical protein
MRLSVIKLKFASAIKQGPLSANLNLTVIRQLHLTPSRILKASLASPLPARSAYLLVWCYQR